MVARGVLPGGLHAVSRPRWRGGHAWRQRVAAVKASRAPCYICGQSIDYTLPHNHKRAYTTGHLVPPRDAPHLALALSNLRPAHRDCNSRLGEQVHRGERRHSRPWGRGVTARP